MSRTHITAMLVLSALAVPASTVFPQAMAPSGVPTTSRQGVVRDNVETCQGAAGGSRIRANCEEPAAATKRTEQPVKLTLDAPPPLSGPQCAAVATTNYDQANTVARVDGTISAWNCSKGSSGTYNLVIRVRDQKGEVNSLEFSDKWSQGSAGQEVKFAADYPIGQDVDLVSVRMHDLQCTCADAPADPAPDPSK
jgi:hypothetical protein